MKQRKGTRKNREGRNQLPPENHSRRNGLPKAIFLPLAVVGSLSYATALLIERPPLSVLAVANTLGNQERHSLLVAILGSFAIVATAFFLFTLWRVRRSSSVLEPAAFARAAKAVWPLTLLGALPFILSQEVWGGAPHFFYMVSILATLACVLITDLPVGVMSRLKRRLPKKPSFYFSIMFLLVAAYCVYVSYHTIQQHYSLQTRAFDLGIMENVFWNSAHGDLFATSLEVGGNHLGVHTSFIFLPFFLLYALFPATETLLILQTVVIALAAWPLFLLARSLLGNEFQALLISGIYLFHPAVSGANFYDFHELAFVPVLLFSVFYFLRTDKSTPFWLMVVLLLSVKEDMAFIVILIGVVTGMTGHRRRGVALITLGAAGYLVLQNLVISHFAGGHHDYSWYYTDIIPAGEGPFGLITTLVVNPLFALKFVFSWQKVLFLFQLLAPVGFLCLLNLPGGILLSYGLASSLLASRQPLHELGFQYSLTIIACMFIGMLFQLESWSPGRRARALVFAACLAFITSYHYGMVYPRHNFRGGFSRVDFSFSKADEEKHREVVEFAGIIPDDASVTASETLVPHVARRRQVETVRYAPNNPGRYYDYYFLLQASAQADLLRLPEVGCLENYRVVKSGRYCVLLKRTSSHASTMVDATP